MAQNLLFSYGPFLSGTNGALQRITLSIMATAKHLFKCCSSSRISKCLMLSTLRNLRYNNEARYDVAWLRRQQSMTYIYLGRCACCLCRASGTVSTSPLGPASSPASPSCSNSYKRLRHNEQISS